MVRGEGLLRSKTNLTLSVIRTNLPKLQSLGLAEITPEGHVILEGINKTNEKLYANSKSPLKHIPIEVSTFVKTKLYSFFIRIHSLEGNQRKMYEKKHNRKEKLKQLASGRVSMKDYKSCINTYKKCQKNPDLIKGALEKSVLSLPGFAKYKDGSKDNKEKGSYWKQKLVSEGLIKSERRYRVFNDLKLPERGKNPRFGVSLIEVKSLLDNCLDPELRRKITYSTISKSLSKELVSGFYTTSKYDTSILYNIKNSLRKELL